MRIRRSLFMLEINSQDPSLTAMTDTSIIGNINFGAGRDSPPAVKQQFADKPASDKQNRLDSGADGIVRTKEVSTD